MDRLRDSDIPDALTLSRAAGWNQTAADWARFLELEPEGCFCIRQAGIVVATAAGIRYGTDLAWIGMVLTHPDWRGRGFARELMQITMRWLKERGSRCIKLDATDQGRPLYEEFGFESEEPIERWARPAQDAPELPRLQTSNGESACALPLAMDRKAFGADRSRLLTRLAQDSRLLVSEDGYAMVRPGANAMYLGPCVCRTSKAARSLIHSALEACGTAAVYWDLLPDHAASAALAKEFGFAPRRRLARMARGCAVTDESLVFAAAGFEYG